MVLIEPLFEEAVLADQVPAIADASWRDGHTERSAIGGAGVRTRPVSDSTPFRAYSVSKPFTALAVVKLSRSGAFSLDDLANDHLGQLEVLDTDVRTAPVTIRHLLTHTAPIEPALMSRGLEGCPRRFTELVNGHISCLASPGENWAYGNEGYGVLSSGAATRACPTSRVYALSKMKGVAVAIRKRFFR